jgi:hypothetical protein
MPTVTSHNKKEHDEKELRRKGALHPVKAKIKLKDRELPVTMHPIEAKNGNEIAHINPEKFDKAFAKTDWQYVGEKGKGGIEGRYEKFANFVKDAPSMHASDVAVSKHGGIVFGDGRHRYAYLRDEGVNPIPVSMDKESIMHAKKHGYLTDKD